MDPFSEYAGHNADTTGKHPMTIVSSSRNSERCPALPALPREENMNLHLQLMVKEKKPDMFSNHIHMPPPRVCPQTSDEDPGSRASYGKFFVCVCVVFVCVCVCFAEKGALKARDSDALRLIFFLF